MYANQEEGIVWLHGNNCLGLDINPFYWTAEGCTLYRGTKLHWTGTGIQVYDDAAGNATTCFVHANYVDPHTGERTYLGTWTFTNYYTGDKRVGP